ncbi:MAG: FG-GAP-like repeat-containing protein [Mangrovicoccus sp.]
MRRALSYLLCATLAVPAFAGPPRFEEVGAEAGVVYMHERAEFDPAAQKIMPWLTAGGAGVAVGDFDKDGLDDIYVVTSLDDRPNALYRNLGDFRFENVAAEMGVADVNTRETGTSAHAIWFDYNADGWEDLLLLRFGEVALFRNLEGQGFEDVAEEAGIKRWLNAMAAAAFDYDRDGDLDLYIGGYFPEKDFHDLPDTKVLFDSWETSRNAGRNYMFRNEGDGTFTDVTDETGTHDNGWTMAIAHGDVNNDGWQDLYNANDFGGDTFFINNGDGSFDNRTLDLIGVDTKKGMNAEVGDYNNDGWLDIYVTNMTEPYLHECNMLWENTFGEGFVDVSTETGSCDTDWGWGAKFFDADNDTLLDIFVATGFISDGEEDYMHQLLGFIFEDDIDIRDATEWPDMAGYSMAGYEPNYFLHQQFGIFNSIGPEAGVDDTGDARGVSIADFDRDGRMDFVVTNVQGPLLVYRNVTEDVGNWLGLQLWDPTSQNHKASGARVELTAGFENLLREVTIGTGFNSASTLDVHFGLGDAEIVENLRVTWPDGTVEMIEAPEPNKWYTVYRGTGKAELLETGAPAEDEAKAPALPPVEHAFVDVTRAAGIDKPHLTPVFDDRLDHIMDMISAGAAGAAVGDYDGDGDLDIFTNSARIDTPNQLWRNNGDFTFTDVAAAAGVADLNDADSTSAGGIFLDYDGDADLDLLVMQMGRTRMMQNQGDGTFVDVTIEAGLDTHYRNTLSAVAFDADADGDLDLYYGVYFRDLNMFDMEVDHDHVMHDSWETSRNAGSNIFWRNNGDGSFTEDTTAAGLHDTGWTMAVGHGDIDNDGFQDVYVANDYGPDRLFRNRGDGSFEDISETAIGVDTKKGMNAEFADVDGDGFLDIYVTNVTEDFLYECNMLWINGQDGTFIDLSQEMNVCDGDWAWGAKFFDADNDADLDLYVGNGFFTGMQGEDYLDVLLPSLWNHGGEDPSSASVWPDVQGMSMASMEKNVFFMNEGGFAFRRIEDGPLAVNSDSRGIFVDDFDNDGRVDVFVTNNDALPMLFRNEAETGNNWLTLKLLGPGQNTDAVGTRVTLSTPVSRQIREVNLGNGFAGSSSNRLYFGLGTQTPNGLTIAWPDGTTQSLDAVPMNQIVTIAHPSNAAQQKDALQ